MGWIWSGRKKKTFLPAAIDERAQSCHSDSQAVSYAHDLSDWPSSLASSLALHWFCQLHSEKFPALLLLRLTSVSVRLCVSSAAMLQWPKEENLQRRGLRQVVQQTVLPGGNWDLHGKWLTQTRLRYYWLGLSARRKEIVFAVSTWWKEYVIQEPN